MNRLEYISQECLEALKDLERQSNASALAARLIHYLKKPFTLQMLWQYRPYLRKLSEEDVLYSPILVCASVACYVLEGEPEQAVRLADKLPKGSRYRTYCALILPTNTWAPFVTHANAVAENGWGPIPNLTVTGGRPYVRNGFRDATPAWEELFSHPEKTEKLLEPVYGARWKNAFEPNAQQK